MQGAYYQDRHEREEGRAQVSAFCKEKGGDRPSEAPWPGARLAEGLPGPGALHMGRPWRRRPGAVCLLVKTRLPFCTAGSPGLHPSHAHSLGPNPASMVQPGAHVGRHRVGNEEGQ